MTALVLGLIVFLGAHSVRILAEPWRMRQIARLGEKRWKGVFALVSFVGLALIVWGYGFTRGAPDLWWTPPLWTRHLAALLTLPAFVLLVAAYGPPSHFKKVIGHPMVAGVALWALAHLIANGRSGDVLLFGAFLIWAVVDFISSRRRDRQAGTIYRAGTLRGDIRAVVIGVVAWLVFAFYLHGWLIGVRPFG
ncbi:MAG: NnrU family protein [Zoogloea sp.]|nr:NnrU family protein [Zoogloea sp.]